MPSCYCKSFSGFDNYILLPAATQTQAFESEFSLTTFLESQELADVEFTAESQHYPGKRGSFKAHRLILALQNEAFRAMFYGGFKVEDKIAITDLHPDGFHGLLRYFYSGRLLAANVSEAFYTQTAAVKYMVPELAQQCVDYVACYIQPGDVCAFLDNILTTGEQDADAPAREMLRKQGLRVLSSTSFVSCFECTVNYVLDHVAGVSEMAVISAVYELAQQQCTNRQQQDSGSAVGVREMMQPFFPKLRFLAISATDFSRGPASWGIFDDNEALALLSNIIVDDPTTMPPGFCKIREKRF
ncbi:BTB/POZ domain-containing protein 3-like isoform X2 [Amblyomma americanum]